MRLILLFLLLIAGCASTTVKIEPQEMTEAQKEAALDADLRPVVTELTSHLAGEKVAVIGFFAEGTKIEPRMATYIRPRIESILGRAGAQVLDRKNLDPIVREQIFSSQPQKAGNLLGADFLVIGTVKDISLNSYRLEIQLLRVDTGQMVAGPFCIVDKKHLPIRYGGK